MDFLILILLIFTFVFLMKFFLRKRSTFQKFKENHFPIII